MPHRLTAVHRYKISDDVLLAILHYLDPVSLYRTCKLYHRVFALVMEFQSLYYKYELARGGMKDGPISYSDASPRQRLQLLAAYRKDWPKLLWGYENKIAIASLSPVRMSGGYITYTENPNIMLKELPSTRTLTPPPRTKHFGFTANTPMECIAVDPMQSLAVYSELHNVDGVVCIRFSVRRLETFGPHPWNSSVFYDFNTHVKDTVSGITSSVCGSRIVISIRFATGKCKHLVMDWRTFQAICLDDLDVHLLSERYLLVLKKGHTYSKLVLYNISSIVKATSEREYELPPTFAYSSLEFNKNTAPLNETPISPTALFFSDPATRVLQIIAKPSDQNRMRSPINHWLFITESYFRPPSRRDQRRSIPWNSWADYCLIRDVSASRYFGAPRLAGYRVFYTELDPTCRPGEPVRTRLHLIDFGPYCDTFDSPHSWSYRGQRSTLIPNECFRELPDTATLGLMVEDLIVTEDNIVLQLAATRHGRTAVVLTFGPPAMKTSRHH